MGTTSNYSWPTPEATDLVKDGWEAIKDLGDAIDTTVAGLPGAGLVHIVTETITGTPSAVNINDVFSSSFKNYKIIITALNTIATDIQFRLRVGGSDNSTANYHRQRFSAGGTSLAGLRTTGATLGVLGECGTAQYAIISEVFAPFLAQPTVLWSENPYNGTNPVFQNHGNFHNVSSSFTGITIFPTSGVFTSGTIQVFGYKD